jgi:hypothetical protein
MTMKFTQLITRWDAGDAQLVISFLDELRDVLCTTYGEDIIKLHRQESESNKLNNTLSASDPSLENDEAEF